MSSHLDPSRCYHGFAYGQAAMECGCKAPDVPPDVEITDREPLTDREPPIAEWPSPPRRELVDLAHGVAGLPRPPLPRPPRTKPAPCRVVLGLDSGDSLVLAGGSMTIEVAPQLPFKADQLYVDAESRCFSVNDILVGRNSQYITPDPVPAGAFTRGSGDILDLFRANPSPGALLELPLRLAEDTRECGLRLTFDVVQVGMSMSVRVTNRALIPARFLGAFIGDTPRRPLG